MKVYLGEILICVAIAPISYGTFEIYPPAGFIVAGILVGALGIVLLPLGSKG